MELAYLYFAHLLYLSHATLDRSEHVVGSYRFADPNALFEHLVVREDNLYIGATNALFQLDSNELLLRNMVRTGPEMDSPYCNWNGRDCIKPRQQSPAVEVRSRDLRGLKEAENDTRTLTNNDNKILLVHSEANVLIACGTLHQGVCSLHALKNIKKKIDQKKPLEAVAANSRNASTVAFIAPGPGDKSTLFVAATHTFEPYREAFPAVCSRSLSERSLLRLVDPGDVSGQSGLHIRTEYRESFRIHYVGGFHSDGFAYWAAVQKSSTEQRANYQSKLLRVCAQDDRYESYSELPLECLGPDNSNYNLLRAVRVAKMGRHVRDSLSVEFLANKEHDTEFLVGVFGRGSEPDKPTAKTSAVCIYPLKELKSTFWFNIQRCQSGVGHWNLPHFGLNQKCHNMSHLPIPADDCLLGQVGGSIPATKAAVLTFKDSLLSAVTVDVVGEKTVLLLGTQDGRLKKAVLESVTEAREYADVQLSPIRLPIASDVAFDAGRKHLFAMAGSEVFKVKLANCNRHRTCATCLQSGDPYCGWCTLQNKCTVVSECSQSSQEFGFIQPSALAPGSGEESRDCPHLVSDLQPQNASVFEPTSTQVTLTMTGLPVPEEGEAYQCIFDESSFVPATFSPPSTLRCPLPPYDGRPKISNGADHAVVPLKLWASATSQIFHEEKFVFFDCGAHQLCTGCVSNRWPCEWCLLDNRCVHDRSLCSNQVQEYIYSSVASARHTSTTGAQQCPRIDSEALKDHKIMLANNQKADIKLPIVNLETLLNKESSPVSLDRLECVMRVEGREARVKATLGSNGWVTCAEHAYTYMEQVPETDAELFLTAGGSYVIDKTTVQLYKCHLLSADCSRCLTLDASYGCHWCGGACRFEHFCPYGSDTGSQECPAPKIDSVHPLLGPLEGGTKVTITGRELGSSIADINRRVFVAGVPCNVIDYEISVKIVCTTEAVLDNYEGAVTVSIGSTPKRKAISSQKFRFVDPSIRSFYPPLGPKSGGTLVTVNGNYLNAASAVRIWFGTLPCAVDPASITSDQISCLTSESLQAPWSTDRVTVELDSANRSLSAPFKYVQDPVVSSIEPLASFQSGGRLLLVRGHNLNSTLKPQIFLIDPIKQRESDNDPTALPPLASQLGDCTPENSTVMWCRSPEVLLSHTARVKRTLPPELARYPAWPIGFKMDGVSALQDLGDRFQMTVTPDPEFFKFPNEQKFYRGDGDEPLILEGRYLSLASTPQDMQVWIGRESCNVTILAASQLICQPPKQQPKGTDQSGRPSKGGRPVVTVRVGNIEQELGELVYKGYGALPEGIDPASFVTPALIGGVVVACGLALLVVLVFVAVWWRRKSWQAEKEYKRIQLQMDNLESNVRQECKQAFAELQTDMSDLTNDIVALGIPYHKRRSYAAKFLFKDDHQQALLLDWTQQQMNGSANGYSSQFHVALAQFEALLWNKQFLTRIVDTWERQPSFKAQDRVYVASLLTASLARNMQYCTEVVLSLLSQLIERSCASKYPQLMLRRTESVVEKMLANWMALCLYDQLQQEAGEKLFLLFKALKHQVEKGPVDAVTGETRYSLSEDRLLKEQIDAEPLLLHVVPVMESGSGETVVCRVLSCDTICQAKSKILDTLYKNHPFSMRPAVQDIDLEWRCSPRGHVVMMDDDRQGPVSKDGWRRLNTLAHYGVPNNAVVALIPKTRGSLTYASSSSQTYSSITSSTALIIPNGHHSPTENSEVSIHYWHLSRPSSACTTPVPAAMTLGRKSSMGKRSENSYSSYSLSASAGGTMPTKSIPEIYLTRLLTSKGIVQKFVDDFFAAVLNGNPAVMPPVVKYLFDFLEKEADRCQVSDPTILNSWRNNSLPLRFWVNVIKNPDFVFDIDKSSSVDACLSVVAQTFMDSCSSSEPRLGKDSPSNKLLFAKDIPKYREMVTRFYKDVRHQPAVTDQDLGAYMAQLSKSYAQEFNVLGAVRELLSYVVKYSDELLSALDQDPVAQRHRLADRLDNVLCLVAGGEERSSPSNENIYAVVA